MKDDELYEKLRATKVTEPEFKPLYEEVVRRKEAETPPTEGVQEPQIAPEPKKPTEVAEIPPITAEGKPEAKVAPEAKTFEKQIKALSDSELGQSLNKMIKIRSQIPDTLVEQWRIEDTDRKIALMEKEWERRARITKKEEISPIEEPELTKQEEAD
ncbi:unnamed protein product, partial [marine sediment metagenome]